ncbi:MAG: putative DNA binding domain-containing protein [Clostridiales Family XIII bacterium]|jgi:predicted HTH transcriptional regulator|nr:putative DNA binding domain-containing protein [Clostridiales Family XIII bacterium]
MVDIRALLSQSENLYLECKLAGGGIPSGLWETYASFANTAGGVILLGVEEKTGRFIAKGVSDPDGMIKDIRNTLNNSQKISANILFDRHIYAADYEGARIVVMEVPRANRQDKPVFVGTDMFRGTFRRNGEGDYHCRPEEIKAMLRDQSDIGPDNTLLENLALDALNEDSVRRYRLMFQNSKPNHVWNRLTDTEFLVKIGAARKGQDRQLHPNLAGLLLFGEFVSITDELPFYFLDYREHLSDSTRWSDRVCSGDGIWSGNVFDFYFKIIERLTADVKVPFALRGGLIRVDETSVHIALREALANALIHADYYGKQGIVIDKEFRKITISNPGTFRVGIEEAIAGGISDARNGRIFNMFALINVGERSGTGLCDLFNVWKEYGFKPPLIKESVDPDRITLTLQIEIPDIYDDPSWDSKDTLNSYLRENAGNLYWNEGNPKGNAGNLDENDGNFKVGDGNPDENEGNLGGNDGDFEVGDGNPEENKGNLGENADNFEVGDGNPSKNEGSLDGNDGDFEVCDGNPSENEGDFEVGDGNLSDNEKCVFDAIVKDVTLSAVKIGEQVGISRSTVERVIRSLKSKGYIEREGSTRGKWIIPK